MVIPSLMEYPSYRTSSMIAFPICVPLQNNDTDYNELAEMFNIYGGQRE